MHTWLLLVMSLLNWEPEIIQQKFLSGKLDNISWITLEYLWFVNVRYSNMWSDNADLFELHYYYIRFPK